ncbi:MAG: tRNA (adenine-N1)-methyltransferase [Candidatus Njordarchaeia archaeon]
MLFEKDFVKLIPLFKTKKTLRYVIKLYRDTVFSTEFGVIHHNEIIGKPSGSVISTHLGYKFIALKAELTDIVKSYKRFTYKTQIIYPRDWGLIVTFANIKNGSKIIEIGTGSGAFTAFLSRIVGPGGHIWSYEKEEERHKNAKKNLDELNLPNNYTLKLANAAEKIEETDVDVVFVDIPEPWTVISNSWRALKPGGVIVIYVPTVNQVKKAVTKLITDGFVNIRVIEGFLRDIQYKPYAIRPLMKGYFFSAYIIFARKSYVIPIDLYEETRKKIMD